MEADRAQDSVMQVRNSRSHAASAPASSAAARSAIIGGRWRFLAEASDLLDHSLDYEETLTNVVQFAVPRIADYASIALQGDDDTLTWACSAHRDPGKEGLIRRVRGYAPRTEDASSIMSRALRTGETQVIGRVDETVLSAVARDAAHLSMLRELELTSLMVLPLTACRRIHGGLLLAMTRDSRRRYTDRDVAIAKELARRVAFAVDHSRLFRAAEQAVRSREEMVAVVSHDLKNPLATIQMSVSFLLDELVPDDDARHSLRASLYAIRRSAEGMHRLVHDLLDVAAIDARQFGVTPSPLTVDVLIQDAMELLRPLAHAKDIALVTHVSTELPPVSVDRARMLQVFSNLGGNALKFTPNNGRIDIHADARQDAMVEFAVCDTGPGIPPEELPRVFDRFWRGKRNTDGSVGLGLAIARGIVEAHRGEIQVDSVPGNGSCFRFTLPSASR